MAATRYVPALELARVTAGLDDREATLRYLEQAVEAREGFVPYIDRQREFEFLHGDPRFVEFVRRVGIGAGLIQ